MNQPILCDDSCDCSFCRSDRAIEAFEYSPPIVPMIEREIITIPVTIGLDVLEALINMASYTHGHRAPDTAMLQIAKNAASAAKELMPLYNGEHEFTN